MFHKGANQYRDEEEVYDLKKVDVSKVLGYQLNNLNNCQNHLFKIKDKISRVNKMIFLAGKNDIDKWKRFYIFM